MPRRDVDNTQDVLDSRDIIARIEELSATLDNTPDDFGEDDAAELAALVALAEEAEGYASDWKYGEALIRDSYFTDYAMELLQDIGDLPRGIPHYIVIDEEATARNIQQDYTSVDFNGVTYWVR